MARVTFRKASSGGTWQVDFTDVEGKRIRKACPPGTKTKKAAEAYLRQCMEEVETTGTFVAARDTPGFTSAARAWLEVKRLEGIESTTWKNHRGHLEKYHIPFFGQKAMKSITYADVERLWKQVVASSLAHKTIVKCFGTLSQVFAYGIKHGYCLGNPCRELPRIPRLRKADNGHALKRYLTRDEIARLIWAVPGEMYKHLVLVAVWTGARQGELLGLKWGDIDLQHALMRIQRSYNHGEVRKTKSVTSDREVPLLPIVVKTLAQWRLKSMYSKPEDLVFPNEAGKHLSQSNMYKRHFQPAVKKAGLESIRFHDLRHTCASLLLDVGMDIKKLQTMLGHASITMTLDRYGHLIRENQQEYMREIASRLGM